MKQKSEHTCLFYDNVALLSLINHQMFRMGELTGIHGEITIMLIEIGCIIIQLKKNIFKEGCLLKEGY